MTKDTIRVQVVISKALVDAVDQVAGKRKRRAFFAEAVDEKLKREQLGRALTETAGFLSEESHSEWETPGKVSAWVRRGRESDGMDDD